MDDFLGGKLKCYQPIQGFRAGFDSVFLAACIHAKPGQKILELGCGAGVALFCLMFRVNGLLSTGIEIQRSYHKLSCKNSELNHLPARLLLGDVLKTISLLKHETFDQVLINPPFYTKKNYTTSNSIGRDIAKCETGSNLVEWLALALKRCSPYGFITIIERPERLALILKTMDGKVGNIRVLPIVSQFGDSANRIIIRVQKGAKGTTKVLWPFIKHEKELNIKGNNDYTSEAINVLKEGAPVYLN